MSTHGWDSTGSCQWGAAVYTVVLVPTEFVFHVGTEHTLRQVLSQFIMHRSQTLQVIPEAMEITRAPQCVSRSVAAPT